MLAAYTRIFTSHDLAISILRIMTLKPVRMTGMPTPCQCSRQRSHLKREYKCNHSFNRRQFEIASMKTIRVSKPWSCSHPVSLSLACRARSRAGTKRNYVGMTSKEDDNANVDDGFDSNDEDEDPDCLSDYPQRSATMGQRPLAKPFNKKNLKRHR